MPGGNRAPPPRPVHWDAVVTASRSPQLSHQELRALDIAHEDANDCEERKGKSRPLSNFVSSAAEDAAAFGFSNDDDDDESGPDNDNPKASAEASRLLAPLELNGEEEEALVNEPSTQPRLCPPSQSSVVRMLIEEYTQAAQTRQQRLQDAPPNPYYDRVRIPLAPREGMSMLSRTALLSSGSYTDPTPATPCESVGEIVESSTQGREEAVVVVSSGPPPAAPLIVARESLNRDRESSTPSDLPADSEERLSLRWGSGGADLLARLDPTRRTAAPHSHRLPSPSPPATLPDAPRQPTKEPEDDRLTDTSADRAFDVSSSHNNQEQSCSSTERSLSHGATTNGGAACARLPATDGRPKATGGTSNAEGDGDAGGGGPRQASRSAPPMVVTKTLKATVRHRAVPGRTVNGSAKARKREMGGQCSLASTCSSSISSNGAATHTDSLPRSSSGTSPLPLCLPPRAIVAQRRRTARSAEPDHGPGAPQPQPQPPRQVTKTNPFFRSASASSALTSGTSGGRTVPPALPRPQAPPQTPTPHPLPQAGNTRRAALPPPPPSASKADAPTKGEGRGDSAPVRLRQNPFRAAGTRSASEPATTAVQPLASSPVEVPLKTRRAVTRSAAATPTTAAVTPPADAGQHSRREGSGPTAATAFPTRSSAEVQPTAAAPTTSSWTPPLTRSEPRPTDEPDVLVPAVKYSYDVKRSRWSSAHIMVRVLHPNRGLSQGGMRVAFEVEELDERGFGSDVVAKMFRRNITDVVEDDYMSECEAQCMCEEFADSFNKVVVQGATKPVISFLQCSVVRIPKKDVPEAYKAARKGFFSYRTTDSHDILFCMEPKLSGNFTKYSSNFGDVYETNEHYIPPSQDRERRRVLDAVEAFSHFTLVESGGSMLVCDLQGVNDFLTDPQIHTEDGKGFGMGNMGQEGINEWIKAHRCGDLCAMLHLQPLTNGLESLTDKKRGSYFRDLVTCLKRENPTRPLDLVPLPKPLDQMTDEERFEYAIRLSEMMDT